MEAETGTSAGHALRSVRLDWIPVGGPRAEICSFAWFKVTTAKEFRDFGFAPSLLTQSCTDRLLPHHTLLRLPMFFLFRNSVCGVHLELGLCFSLFCCNSSSALNKREYQPRKLCIQQASVHSLNFQLQKAI